MDLVKQYCLQRTERYPSIDYCNAYKVSLVPMVLDPLFIPTQEWPDPSSLWEGLTTHLKSNMALSVGLRPSRMRIIVDFKNQAKRGFKTQRLEGMVSNWFRKCGWFYMSL